MKFHTDLRKCY